MPELPDVEIFTRYFNKTSLSQTITSVEVFRTRILRCSSFKALRERLDGSRFVSAERYGKYLFARIGKDGYLVFHFGMTGSLCYFRGKEIPRSTRFMIDFVHDARLAFVDPRVFGKVDFTESVQDYVKEKRLGPDAMNVGLATFKSIIQASGRPIKAELMDQKRIAGIGNIYSDEILFQSGVAPTDRSNKLDDGQLADIYRNMKKVLKAAIAKHADPDALPKKYYLLPHRGKEEECPRGCGHIKRIKVSGRTAYYCPACQK